jgi:putative DNA primase/helicase
MSYDRPLPKIDFRAVASAAIPYAHELCGRWLPGGKLIGHEWTCGNLSGGRGTSCKVNIRNGKWADFAEGKSGGDLISLCAAVHNLSQIEAAIRMAEMLGLRK